MSLEPRTDVLDSRFLDPKGFYISQSDPNTKGNSASLENWVLAWGRRNRLFASRWMLESVHRDLEMKKAQL